MYLSFGYSLRLLIIIYLLDAALAWYYDCDHNNCKEGYRKQPHILCSDSWMKKKAFWGSQGKLLTIVPNTQKMIEYYIEKHNYLRNKMASGTEISVNMDSNKVNSEFPAAAALRELIWDPELEYMCYVHSSKCFFDHDLCHSTNRFSMSGQNLALTSRKAPASIFTINDIFFREWYNEKNFVNEGKDFAKAFQNKYRKVGPGGTKTVGHLFQLMNHQVSRVGCALSICRHCKMRGKLKEYCYFLCCDFDHCNVLNRMAYETGEPRSRCNVSWDQGKSKKWPNLCANNGKIYTLKSDRVFQSKDWPLKKG